MQLDLRDAISRAKNRNLKNSDPKFGSKKKSATVRRSGSGIESTGFEDYAYYSLGKKPTKEKSKMNEEIFRKKSLDKVKSPECLDDYIQVSNPSVWLLLISAIVLLAGACVWGIFGHIDSAVETSVRVENGAVICNIEAESVSSVQTGLTVKCDGFEAVITEISQVNGDYVCYLQSEQAIPDGVYAGELVTERIKPISFILN